MATVSLTPDGWEPGSPDEAPVVAAPVGKLGEQYVLLREIASGGMGRVYLARETGESGFSRNVALKRIHEHLASRPEFVTMFLDEARIASRIQHAHVCTVFDFGKVDDAYYISMEYLRGQPFSELLRELGREAPEQCPERVWLGAWLLQQACEGLHAAHELRDDDGTLLNVVHRDVSPHNLFVTYDGSMRVLDFGVARAADRLADSTTGRVKGKFAYMAPEQALGRSVDRRADLFSLGVVLWELLTLRRLFKRDNPGETVLAVVQREAPAPSSIVRDVPPELEAIVMRALSHDPDVRFATAREMGRALSKAIASSGAPVGAADVTDWLDQLFPGAREASYRLLRSVDEAMERPLEPTPTHTRDAKPGARRAQATQAATTELSVGDLMPLSRVPPPPPRRRPWIWIAAGAFALAISGVGVGLMLSPDPPPPTATLPSVSLPTLPPTPVAAEPAPIAASEETLEEPSPAPLPEALDEPVGASRRARPRRRPARPAPRATLTGRGQARFSGPSELWGARIFHGGRQVGTVPGTVTLPAGRQRVEIAVPGRPRDARTVDVPAGGVARVVLR